MRCPTCKIEHKPLTLDLGPFCSSRCQLIDLGQWLSEEYRLPDHSTLVSEEELEAALQASEPASEQAGARTNRR
jgi:endogenous inhibitor of DNA gyrase (YacG/DUF329 family)